MKTKTTAAIAFALLALGGSAMAAPHHHRAAHGFYGAHTRIPFNAYASYPGGLRGRSNVSASEPGWNPALDRAKGGF